MKKIYKLFTGGLLLGLLFANNNYHFVVNASINTHSEESKIISDINSLINKYRHSDVYTRDTEIYLNENSLDEIKSVFHAQNDLLKRTTYFSNDELWMTNGLGKYSYYGTDENGNLTNATVDIVGERSKNVAIFGVSMQDHYYTMYDIVAKEDHGWSNENGVYSCNNEEVFTWFKGFTAPCYLGFNSETSNYVLFEKAEIEETDSGLELRLIAKNIEAYKLTNSDNIFSRAIITYNHKDDYGVVLENADSYKEGLIEHTCLDCKEKYQKVLFSIPGHEVDVYPSFSNADIVSYQGNIYTYGGSPDGRAKLNKVYCYNTYSDKLYELDLTLENGSTSHRVILYQDKVYIFGGLNGPQFKTIQVHDLKNNTLTTLEKEMPFGANCFQIGLLNDKAYFVGGALPSSTPNIFQVDMNTFEIELMDVTLPTKVFKGGWLTVGKYVYVIGGTNGARLNTIFRYDMVNNKVETMSAKLPYNLSQCRLAFDGEDNIYIVGGTNDAGKLVKDVLVYSISHNEVTDFKFDLPYPLANTCISMVNGKLYVLGGDNDTTNTILRLDENGFSSLR